MQRHRLRPQEARPEAVGGDKAHMFAHMKKHILDAHMKSLCSGSQTNAEYIDAEHLTGSTLLRRLFLKLSLIHISEPTRPY